MKVLHVIDALGVGGGAEHSLAAMAPLLRDRGVESRFACLLPRQRGLEYTLRDQGFDVEVLGSSSPVGRVRALRRKMRAERPDLVHATLYNASLVARFAAIRSGVPLVNSLVNTSYDPVRVDDLQIPRWKLDAVRMADAVTARHLVDHVHAITESVAAEATDVLGVDPRRITVIPRGRSSELLGAPDVDRRRSVRAGLGLADDTPVVLNVGRQDHQKGQADLVRAFAAVRDELPDAVLLVAGREGDATGEIAAAVAATGMGDAVRFLGHRTDVYDLYVATDVFAFPSYYEGLGCSLIEAMGLGAPIVGSDAAAISEVLGGGEFGEVVGRGDVAGLAAAMIGLLGSPDRRRDIAERARRRFDERYELDRVVDAMVAMYRGVLAADR